MMNILYIGIATRDYIYTFGLYRVPLSTLHSRMQCNQLVTDSQRVGVLECYSLLNAS